ncbi:cell wall hydrolase [Rhizobium sp. L80/93]
MRTHSDWMKSFVGIFVVGLTMAGCTTMPKPETKPVTRIKTANGVKVTYNYTREDRECLKRAMYAESLASDPDGYLAVGTVVANRLTSPAYPKTICGVVGQEKQFAPGVMKVVIKDQAEPTLDAAADAILHGERHPALESAMFFHTQGLKYPYGNMHYVAVAGGNAFYEKRAKDGTLETPPPLPAYEVAMNYVGNQQASEQITSPQFDHLLPATGPVPAFTAATAFAPTSMKPIDTAFTVPQKVVVPIERPDYAISGPLN